MNIPELAITSRAPAIHEESGAIGPLLFNSIWGMFDFSVRARLIR